MICNTHGNQWRWDCLECLSFGTVKHGTGYAKPTIATPPAPASESQRIAAGTADEKPDGPAEND